MSDLTNRAIARITEECQKKEYLIPFEEYLTSIMNDKVAEKVLKEEKTLQGCFDEMEKAAKKHMIRNGNVGPVFPPIYSAYIPPEEGFSIIRSYYGIDLTENSGQEPGVIDITDFL